MKLVGNKDNQAVTTSLVIAKEFGKAHRSVLNSISNLAAQNYAVESMFVKGTYKNRQGHEQPMYYMNRDGFSLLAMGFTGKRAMEFKLKFIDQFNQMEQTISSNAVGLPQTPEEKLSLTMDVSNRTAKRVGVIEGDVKMLKDNMRITGTQEKALLDTHRESVFKALGGKESNAYLDVKVRDKAFRAEWHEFKQMFHLPRYGELPQAKFNEGINFLKVWEPNTELRLEIKKANDQTNLDI